MGINSDIEDQASAWLWQEMKSVIPPPKDIGVFGRWLLNVFCSKITFWGDFGCLIKSNNYLGCLEWLFGIDFSAKKVVFQKANICRFFKLAV